MTLDPKSFLIDSGTLIRHLRGDARASELLTHLAALGEITVSVVSVFEVYRGDMNEREDAITSVLFQDVAHREIDFATARAAAEIARANPGILRSERAAADALIAGTALVHRATLVTLNTRQLSKIRVPGLGLLLLDQRAENWIPT